MSLVVLEDQALVFVVRKDGEPGLYLQPGVSKVHAVALFQMMIERLTADMPDNVNLDGDSIS